MKVIDLLNKIAKGEEVPKRIKYNDKNWNYKDGIMEYISDDTYFCFNNFDFDELNDEVEIIEEEPKKNKIEKINNAYYHLEQEQQNQLFKHKINEIIDYLEEIE